MTKVKSLPAFVADNFKLQRSDFWIMALAETGLWALMMLVIGAVYWFVRDPEVLAVGVPGICAFAMAVLCSLISSMVRIQLEVTVGIQMSVPRRRMAAAALALNLALGAMMLALAALLDQVWMVLYAGSAPGTGVEDIVKMIPAWGWLVAWLLPAGLGMLAGALVLRFGRRAGWVLYFVFLAGCWSPMLLEDRIEKSPAIRAAWEAVLPLLPVLGPAVALAAIAAGVILLLRITITR